jgi:O-antigen/teichoic acid export membrane protein
MSLKAKTFSALSWSLIQEVLQRGLQFAIGILLARLLEPKEFGLLAMLTIFIAVSQALVDSGFGSALIQRKEATGADECSVFYFNVSIAAVLVVILYMAAPWIAVFYKQPQLTHLLRALSVVLVINSVSVVQNSLMVRRLDFKRQAVVAASSMMVSGIVAVLLAWRGYGVWSLVGQQVCASIVRTAMLWWLNPWRPHWVFSKHSLRDLFAFGSRMMASSLANRLFDNLISLVIGKAFSPVMLGFYNRAATLQDTASQSLAGIANRVTFPVFSQLQDDPGRMKRGLKKAMTTIAFVQFPLLIGLAVVAKPLVLVLLTEKWVRSAPYLQLLCFAGMFYPVHLLNLNVLLAMGRSDLFFRLEVIKRFLQLLAIIVTFKFGVLAMVWGQVATSFISLFINGYYTKRFIGYSIPEQIRDLAPYLVASAVMGAVVALVNFSAIQSSLAQLVFKIVIGVATYGILSCGLKLDALKEMGGFARNRLALTT